MVQPVPARPVPARIAPLAQVCAAAVEALLDSAFAPGRQTRTAYRIREGTEAIAGLSFAAFDRDALVATIQCWPVTLTDVAGQAHPLVMVGPVAVAPRWQQGGIGRALMEHMLRAAAREGMDGAMMLIGDPEYYGRFGFVADRTGAWALPGPFERRRLLARGPDVPAVAGELGPRIAAPA